MLVIFETSSIIYIYIKLCRKWGKGWVNCSLHFKHQSINYCGEAFVIRYTTCTVYVYDDELEVLHFYRGQSGYSEDLQFNILVDKVHWLLIVLYSYNMIKKKTLGFIHHWPSIKVKIILMYAACDFSTDLIDLGH